MLPEIACLYFDLVFFLLNLGPSNIWEHLIFATNMERQVFLISFCAVFLIYMWSLFFNRQPRIHQGNQIEEF